MTRDSQLGQADWVMELFPDKTDGYFLDVGAGNGVRNSNTYALELLGWGGLCIEAEPAQHRELQHHRKCDTTQRCVLDATRFVVFKSDAEDVDESGILEYVRPHKRNRRGTLSRINTTPLADILQEFSAPSIIDYLSIDTEGSEYLILKTFPFDKYQFMSLSVEHNYQGEKRKRIRELLEHHGYQHWGELKWDDLYVWGHR